MNRLYYFFKTINKARSMGSLPETKYNSVRSLSRLFFDLLFFKDTRSISITFNNWLGMNILNLFSTKLAFLFFFQEVKRVDLKKYYDNLYRVNEVTPLMLRLYPSKKFKNIKSSLNPFINESTQIVFNDYEIYLNNDHDLIKTLTISNFFNQNISTQIAYTGFSNKFNVFLEKEDYVDLVLKIFYSGSQYSNVKILWASEQNNESLAIIFTNLYKKFNLIRLYDTPLNFNINIVNKANSINKIKLAPINFKNLNFKITKNDSIINYLSRIKLTKADIKNSISMLAIKPIKSNPTVFVSFVNNIVNAKSYTMRSRQFYRSGVLWCLALTLVTVITPYYIFYGFTFVFSYWWFFTFIFFLRYSIIFLWKLTPTKIKFKLNDYLNI